MSFENIRIGLDPEIFLKKGDDVVSAIGRFPGTKQDPFPIGGGHFIQVDGLAVEFNTPPTNNWEHFNDSIDFCRNYIKGQGYKEYPVDIATFKPEDLEVPEAKIMGCDRDYCVWTKSVNKIQTWRSMGMHRVAGGHIHISWDLKGQEQLYKEQAESSSPVPTEDQENMVRVLDYFVGAPLTCAGYSSHNRRIYYGAAGCFRCKPYGVEYRTPGNMWIFYEKGRRIVWEGIHKAVDALNSENKFRKLSRGFRDFDMVVTGINSGGMSYLKKVQQFVDTL